MSTLSPTDSNQSTSGTSPASNNNPTSSLAGKTKTKKTRSRKGCQRCRSRRVACVEGVEGPEGKLPCKACVRRGELCLYPRSEVIKRTVWRHALPVLPGDGGSSSSSPPSWSTGMDVLAVNQVFEEQVASDGVDQTGWQFETGGFSNWLLAAPDLQEYDPMAPFLPLPLVETQPPELPPSFSHPSSTPSSLHPIPPLPPQPPPPLFTANTSSLSTLTSAILKHNRFFGNPLPSLSLPMLGSTIDSLDSTDRDLYTNLFSDWRQIEAVNAPKRSFFFGRLLPYLSNMFYSASAQSQGALLLFHCAMRASSLDRGTKVGVENREKYMRAAQKHQRRAVELWRTRSQGGSSEHLWISQSLIIVGDILSSRPVNLEACAELATTVNSELVQTGKDVIAVYAIMVDLSIPHRRPTGTVLVADSSMSIVHPSTSPRLSASTHLALSDDGPDFIETTFGVSRPMWKLIRRVTTIVAASRQYQDDATPVGRMQAAYARAEAEAIVAELWHAWEFSDKWQQSGRPLRVQQGTMMYRGALTILLLCEVLFMPLTDSRVAAARQLLLETVAETSLSQLGLGYMCPLMIGAAYSYDPSERQDFLVAFESVRMGSVRSGVKSVLMGAEVALECWKLYDEQGGYEDGIAPWRSVLHGMGVNLVF